MKNVIWHKNILAVGGIETFLYNLAAKYRDRDITIYYQNGDPAQLARLSKVCRVVKWRGERIKCDRLFCNYDTTLMRYADADEYFQILHADWTKCNLSYSRIDPRANVVAVSHATADPYEAETGKTVKVTYLPMTDAKPKRVLNLVSATRMSRDKGSDRMSKLADALDREGIPFVWLVFTDGAVADKRLTKMQNRLDVLPFIANADYLVQLSDSEGFCYTVNESLMVGTPVIVTPCPAFTEIGVNDKNGFTLPFDMDEIPVEKIYAGLPEFKFKPKPDKWGSLLLKGRSQQEPEPLHKMVCIYPYYDMYLGRDISVGEIIEEPIDRVEILSRKRYAREI